MKWKDKMKKDKNILDIVRAIRECCDDYVNFVSEYNECAYSDRKLESILRFSDKLLKEYNANFENAKDKYEYKVLNYWINEDDIYVNYTVEDSEFKDIVNSIGYYNISNIDCDYNTASAKEIIDSLTKIVRQNDGWEFKLPKISDSSSLLKYIYDYVCESDSDMCHIDYGEWEEMMEENAFAEEDLEALKNDIKKYNLYDYIELEDNEYKICAYGGLQCCFNDDRKVKSDELER